MPAARIKRAQELFEQALECAADDQRKFLESACEGDEALLIEVLSLLEHDLTAEDTFLQVPSFPPIKRESEDVDPLLGSNIGRYKITRRIAAGGMGAVYEAQQAQPKRTVAVKLLRAAAWSPSARRRFEFESQVLSRLTHPNIAQVYEAGTHNDQPYFAMEFVADALPITKFIETSNLSIHERLALFLDVCDAVQHGHQKGIIHRDLKPGNILVDGDRKVKVIDFGVARSTDSDVAVTTMRTSVGELIGTLQYMSPEQCDADPLSLDVRSDVYSLGIVLYQMLTGDLPYDVAHQTIHCAARTICEQTATRPSSIDVRLRGDLETIVLKAIEKVREHRFQSASEFADDLRRYLAHEPIKAKRTSKWQQFRLFARRNRGATLFAFGLFLALITFSITITLMLRSLQVKTEAERVQTVEARWQAYIGAISRANESISMLDVHKAARVLDGAPTENRNWGNGNTSAERSTRA